MRQPTSPAGRLEGFTSSLRRKLKREDPAGTRKSPAEEMGGVGMVRWRDGDGRGGHGEMGGVEMGGVGMVRWEGWSYGRRGSSVPGTLPMESCSSPRAGVEVGGARVTSTPPTLTDMRLSL